MRVPASAAVEAVQVAVGEPAAQSAAEDAQEDVEDRVRERVGDAGAQGGEDDLDQLPAPGAEEPYNGAGDGRAPGGGEELVVPASPVDDLRDDRHEREGGDEVRDLVVEQDRLEEAERETRRVEGDAENYQQYA